MYHDNQYFTTESHRHNVNSLFFFLALFQCGRSYSAPGITRIRRQPTLRDANPTASPSQSPPSPPHQRPGSDMNNDHRTETPDLLRLNIDNQAMTSSSRSKLPPGAVPKSCHHHQPHHTPKPRFRRDSSDF